MGNKQYERSIIAVDFDDTLFKHSYPADNSEPNWAVINYVRQKKREGAYIILFTCRHTAEDLNFAIESCRNVGIEFDAVNDNLDFMKQKFGDCRKVFCNEYIDDKNVLISDIEYGGGDYDDDSADNSQDICVVVTDSDSGLEPPDLHLDTAYIPSQDAVAVIADLVAHGYIIHTISVDSDEWSDLELTKLYAFVMSLKESHPIIHFR